MASRRGGSAAVAGPTLPPLEPQDSKLRPPPLRSGGVPRNALIDRLRGAKDARVVFVSAPPGYGKTTLLAQWASRSRAPFAWLTLDQHDNDPVVLLGHIAAALERVSALEADAGASPGSAAGPAIAKRVASRLSGAGTPFVLALDDLHFVDDPRSVDALDALVDHLPGDSRLVLCGRSLPPRRLAALRASGLLFEIGPDELRMDRAQADELLRAVGVVLSDTELGKLVERTEGWPAGLYLAALATRRGGATGLKDATTFRGDDRFVAEYLRSELLSDLPADELRFLTRTAVLDRMCGPLCDAVLGARGSAEALDSLERSNLFVVALDPSRQWYRYHHLFRELLRAELERAEPGLAPDLLARASAWSEKSDLSEAAVGYAQGAGNVDRVAALVTTHGQAAYQRGHAVTVERWLEWLEKHDGLERSPLIAALGAWHSAIRGQAATAERWTDWAERGLLEGPVGEADRTAVELWLALLRAAQCRQGVAKMRADAERAAEGFGRASPHWPTAAVLLALSHLLGGEEGRAEELFADVAETAAATGAANAGSISLAERALIAGERAEWEQAEAYAGQAGAIVRRSGMEDYPPNALAYAAAALVAIHRDDREAADGLLARAQRMRPQLTYALCPFSIQARLVLARAYAARADIAGARTLLREAGGLLRRGRDFGVLAAQADELRAKLDTATAKAPGASTLTSAELRLLPLLATHLTFREIGERLYVSRHTVKSQAISIYRKLDVTSRNAAVERSRELGLL